MDQHKWVRACQARYKEQGLTPGDPNDGDWDECHYPEPKDFGEEVIYLLHDHHQPQGLWQSEEYNRPCFFSGDAKRFLTHGPFVPGWFDLWGLYDKWSGYHGRIQGKKTGKSNIEACHAHPNTTKVIKTNGESYNKRESKPVKRVEDGRLYKSVSEAARDNGVVRAGVQKALRTGRRAGGFHWEYPS